MTRQKLISPTGWMAILFCFSLGLNVRAADRAKLLTNLVVNLEKLAKAAQESNSIPNIEAARGALFGPQFYIEELKNELPSFPQAPNRILLAMITTLNTVNAKRDYKFDFNDLTAAYVFPPFPYDAGIDPRYIREPEIRRTYEEALKKKREWQIVHRKQLELKTLQEHIILRTKEFSSKAVSLNPSSRDEFAKTIKSAVTDEASRNLLIQYVEDLPAAAPPRRGKEFAKKFQILANHPETLQTQSISEIERTQLIGEGKVYYESCPSEEKIPVRFLLIELGDQDMIRQTIIELQNAAYGPRKPLERLLNKSSQLEIIPLLIPDLLREESSDLMRESDEFFVYPPSVRAARIIRSVLLNSAKINNPMKVWARSIGDKSVDHMRGQLRDWWASNKVLFAEKTFALLTPPAASKPKEK